MRKRVVWWTALLVLLWTTGVASDASAERQTTELTRGWRFEYGVTAPSPEAAAFDDSAWQSVRIPHTWSRLGEYRLERSADANNAQGVGEAGGVLRMVEREFSATAANGALCLDFEPADGPALVAAVMVSC